MLCPAFNHAQRFKYPIATYPLTLGAGETDGITLNADTTESVCSNLVTDSGFDAVTETNEYTSDFSSDADGFANASGTVVAGDIDGIGGQDNNLRATTAAGYSVHQVYFDLTMAIGDCFRFRFDYYLPSANTKMDQIKLTDGNGAVAYSSALDTVDAWTAVDVYVNVVTLADRFRVIGLDGGVVTFDQAGDLFYLRNVRIEAVTFTHWTAETGWAPQAMAGALTGKAQKVAGTAGSINQNLGLQLNKTLRFGVKVNTVSAGSFKLMSDSSAFGDDLTVGSHIVDRTVPDSNMLFGIYGDATAAGVFSYETIRQVTNPKQNGITIEIDAGSNKIYTSTTEAGVTTVQDTSDIVYGDTYKLIALKDALDQLWVFYNDLYVCDVDVSGMSFVFNKRHYIATGEGSGAFSVERLRLGGNIVTDPSFDNWTGTRLDDWGETSVTLFEDTGYGGSGSSVRITTTAVNNAVTDQTNTVIPGTLMVFQYAYKNTAGDTAEIQLWDATNSANILSPTSLGDSTSWSTGEYYFIVPVGCTLMHVNLGAVNDTDIVWFDDVYLKTVNP